MTSQTTPLTAEARTTLDDRLSNRFIQLDPEGYFIIYVDREEGLVCAKHFTNTINDRGLACDPETGDVLCSKGNLERLPTAIYKGRTAKELCIEIFEKTKPCPITYLDHAAYLGREFVKAELALTQGTEYIQD